MNPESQPTTPEPWGLLKLVEIGCKIQNEHANLICRLTEKGICPRCLGQLSACGWCHYTHYTTIPG